MSLTQRELREELRDFKESLLREVESKRRDRRWTIIGRTSIVLTLIFWGFIIYDVGKTNGMRSMSQKPDKQIENSVSKNNNPK